MLYSQKPDRRQISKRIWNLPLEFVSVKIHANEFFQIAQLIGDLPSYVISIKFPVIKAMFIPLSSQEHRILQNDENRRVDSGKKLRNPLSFGHLAMMISYNKNQE